MARSVCKSVDSFTRLPRWLRTILLPARGLARRRALLEDGQQPAAGGWLLAGPESVAPLLRRNEVLVPLASFVLW